MTNIVKGKLTDIPETLTKRNARNSYDWDKFNVGDHAEFKAGEEGNRARASALAFGRGTKDRPPRTFATQTVEKPDGNKVLQVWRLADPEQPKAEAKDTK